MNTESWCNRRAGDLSCIIKSRQSNKNLSYMVTFVLRFQKHAIDFGTYLCERYSKTIFQRIAVKLYFHRSTIFTSVNIALRESCSFVSAFCFTEGIIFIFRFLFKERFSFLLDCKFIVRKFSRFEWPLMVLHLNRNEK